MDFRGTYSFLVDFFTSSHMLRIMNCKSKSNCIYTLPNLVYQSNNEKIILIFVIPFLAIITRYDFYDCVKETEKYESFEKQKEKIIWESFVFDTC